MIIIKKKRVRRIQMTDSFYMCGKYADAIVYTHDVEKTAVKQIHRILNHPAFQIRNDEKIAIMPDCHAGAGTVIGFTMPVTDKIVPNVIGVDINCGVIGFNLGNIEIDYHRLDEIIHESIPGGMNIREKTLTTNAEFKEAGRLKDLCKRIGHDYSYALRSIGTLGGGNHFIEIDEDQETEEKWLVVHTGSRKLGYDTARYYQNLADEEHSNGDLSYLTGNLVKDYYRDMQIASDFANVNRAAITSIILMHMGLIPKHTVASQHNYIDSKDKIIRKGAISAHEGEEVIIPLNMAEGCIIGIGKGNKKWNYSAPHGLGRKMSRRKAKDILTMDTYKDITKHIRSTCVNEYTIDESPEAYKDSTAVLNNIDDTVEIKSILKTQYNFKGY
jgi:RNA-splicing ligase RtcB